MKFTQRLDSARYLYEGKDRQSLHTWALAVLNALHHGDVLWMHRVRMVHPEIPDVDLVLFAKS